MKKGCAFIVIDSGFSEEVLGTARVMAAWDLTQNRKFEGDGLLSPAQLADFAGDPMGHGSIVLSRLLAQESDARLILAKAFDKRSVCRTRFQDGKILAPGWTEAYVWAVEFARARSMVSVCNCSFGGFTHAGDGTGWEAFQIASCSGSGKSGHVLVAAAGPGDGRAVHAAMRLLPGENKDFQADQEGDCEYNFWFGLGQSEGIKPWQLQARLNGEQVYSAVSAEVPPNFWNGRQQLKFRVWGAGRLSIDLSLSEQSGAEQKVDVFADSARFRNWVSPEQIIEPASFASTIAVGLKASTYSAFQEQEGNKPDVLLSGSGQISFRLPEITAAVGKLLADKPHLDVDAVKGLLGKYPL